MAGLDADTKLLFHFNADGPQRPYAHFKCNDDAANTTVTDDGSGANNGISSTNTSNLSVVGKVNDCFELVSASSEYFYNTALATDIKTDTTGSWAFWINMNDTSAALIVSDDNYVSTDNGFRMHVTSGAIRLLIRNGGTNELDANITTTSQDGSTWYHVAFVQDGTQLKGYVDGAEVTVNWVTSTDQGAWHDDVTNQTRVWFGSYNGGAGPGSFFNGKLDDVRYYQNYALGPAEVAFLYNAGSGREDNGSDGLKSAYAHYKCNDDAANTTVTDDGSGTNNGTSSTNTSNLSIAGKINDGFELIDTSSEYINLDALQTDIVSDTTGSIAFWTYPYNSSGNYVVFSMGDANGASYTNLYHSNGSMTLNIVKDASNYVVWQVGGSTANTWVHWVMVQDGARFKMYRNSVLQTLDVETEVGSGTVGDWFADMSAIDVGRIGCENNNSGGNASFWDGIIDDFRYYKCALSQAEVTQLYNSNSGTEDSIIVDATGNHTDTTSYATAQMDTNVVKWGGGSLLLDGNSDYLALPDSADWDIGSDFIIDLQVKHDDHAGTEAYLEQYVDATNYWVFEHISGTGLHFQVDGGGADINISGGEITDTARWHHVAIIKVGSLVGIYRDGVQVAYGTAACTTTFADLLSIGARIDPTNYFDGYMDEVRIQHSNYFEAGPLPDPYAWYKCNELDDSTVVNDDGTGANNGTASVNTDNLTSAALIQDGVFNECAQFRYQERLIYPASSDWDFAGGDWSVDFWMNTEHAPGGNWEGLVTSWDYASADRSWTMYLTGAAGAFQLLIYYSTDGSSSTPVTATNLNYTLGDWAHIAVERDGSNINIFQDGVRLRQEGGHGATFHTNPSTLHIGSYEGGAANTYYIGKLDEVRVSKGLARWEGRNFTPPTTAYTSDANTQLLLHFDGNFTDSGNTGHALSSNTGVTVGNAFDYNGSESINIDAIVTDIETDTTGTWTYWVKGSGAGNQVTLGDTNNNGYWQTHYWGSTTELVAAWVKDNGTDKWVLTSTLTIPAGTWGHVAIVQNGTSPRIYVNGELDPATATGSDTTWWYNTQPSKLLDNARLGCINYNNTGDQQYFTGQMEDVRYYQNVALTAEQVSAIYNGGAGLHTKQDFITVPTEEYSSDAVPRSQGVIIV